MDQISVAISSSLANSSKVFKSLKHQLREFTILINITNEYSAFIASDLYKSGNHLAGKLVFEKILHYSKILEEISTKTNSKITRDQKTEIILAVRKIKGALEYNFFAFNLKKNDFFCLDEEHERKVALRSITTIIPVQNPELLSEQVEAMFEIINVMKAVMYKTYKYKESTCRNLMTGWLVIYYSKFAKTEAKRLSRLYDSIGKTNLCRILWDVNESKFMRKVIEKTLPKIEYTEVIFLPRLATHVLDNIQEELMKNNEETNDDINQESLKNYEFRLVADKDHKYVPARILSRIPLLIPLPDPVISPVIPSDSLDSLIIHAHGGGYISTSSFSHQNFTRRWANEIPVPVFSLDYRLAPEHPFPEGLDDVWQSYVWLVNYSYKFLGFHPKKIILVGDSAGGCLVAAVTIKAITSGFRVPDGLLLLYPGINMDRNIFSSSFLVSLENGILSFPLYKVIADAYLKNGYTVTNPLVSPLCCSEEILSRFPRTELMLTENDPLCYDNYRFAEKLLRAGVDVHVTAFPQFIHGAMGFASEDIVPLYSGFFEKSCELMRGLLDI